MKRHVSLNDIAQRLNVSKMTVSLALRNNPRISEKMRRKVNALADQLGYKPNPEVTRYMSAIRKVAPDDKGMPLAYLTTGKEKGLWRDSPTELHYWEGAASRAELYGYYLEEYWLEEPHMTERRISDILWNRSINGVIIPPFFRMLSQEEKDVSLRLKWNHFSAVSISDMLTKPVLNRVIHDHYTSILTLMDVLIEKGYRRIGLCLTHHMDLTVNRRWQAGYRVYRANHPIDRIEPLIEEDLSAPSIQRWIKRNRLDAVVGAERRMPQFFKEMGYRMGKDLAYADLDVDLNDPKQKQVSGIVQNSEMMGKAAVDMVVSAIQRNENGIPDVPLVLQIEGTWHDRGSCKV